LTADLGVASSTWGAANSVTVSCVGNVVAGPFTSTSATLSETFDPSSLCNPAAVYIYAGDTTTSGAKEIKNMLAAQGEFRPSLLSPSSLFTAATSTSSCSADASPAAGYIETTATKNTETLCAGYCHENWLNGCRAFAYNPTTKDCKLHPKIAALTTATSGTNFCRLYLEPDFSSTKLVLITSTVPHGFSGLLKHLPVPVIAMGEASQVELGLAYSAMEFVLTPIVATSIADALVQLPPGLYPGDAHMSIPLGTELMSSSSIATNTWIGSTVSSSAALTGSEVAEGSHSVVGYYRCQAALNAGRRVAFGLPEISSTEIGPVGIKALGQAARWAIASGTAAELVQAQNLLTFSVQHFRPTCAKSVPRSSCWGGVVRGDKVSTINIALTSKFLGTTLASRFATEYRTQLWVEKEEWRGFQITTSGVGAKVQMQLDSRAVLTCTDALKVDADVYLTRGWHEFVLYYTQEVKTYKLTLQTRKSGSPVWSLFELANWNTPFMDDVADDCPRATAAAQAVPAKATRTSIQMSALLAAKTDDAVITQGVSLEHTRRRLARIDSLDIVSKRLEYETTVPVDENFERKRSITLVFTTILVTPTVGQTVAQASGATGKVSSYADTTKTLVVAITAGTAAQEEEVRNKFTVAATTVNGAAAGTPTSVADDYVKVASGSGEISFGTQGDAYWILSTYHSGRKSQTMYRKSDLLAFDPPLVTGDIIKKNCSAHW
jgi:hypothetical protein